MIGLGMSAVTIASHTIVIMILILGGYRLIRSLEHGVAIRAVKHHGLTPALASAAVALGVERAYYITARTLRPTGLDLWQMHPAPELLSLIVSVGLYAATAPLVLARMEDLNQALRVFGRDWMIFAAVFGAIVWGLF